MVAENRFWLVSVGEVAPGELNIDTDMFMLLIVGAATYFEISKVSGH